MCPKLVFFNCYEPLLPQLNLLEAEIEAEVVPADGLGSIPLAI
jgi:hypothetical protein